MDEEYAKKEKLEKQWKNYEAKLRELKTKEE